MKLSILSEWLLFTFTSDLPGEPIVPILPWTKLVELVVLEHELMSLVVVVAAVVLVETNSESFEQLFLAGDHS